MPTVTLPGVGPVERKWLIGGGVAALAYVVYRYWKASHAAPADTGSLIDPQTGLPYSAENLSTGGYVNPNPVTSVDTTTGSEIRTNAQWVAAVVEALSNIGTDPSWTGAVMGKYLASQPLTSDEANTVRVAWAFKGKPPEGPNTFTLATDQSTPGGSSSGTLTMDYNGGEWLDAFLLRVNAAHPNLLMTKAKLVALNPNLPIARADAEGYLSASNPPGPGAVQDVFGASGTAKLN